MTSILIVCEGNICRSPYVERVLAARLQAVDPGAFQVTSVGTAADDGMPMVERSIKHVLIDGGDPTGFASRRLRERSLEQVDLVLTLEREHRADVLDIAPRLLRRTFTLSEFSRLVAPLVAARQVGPDFWTSFPHLVAGTRLETAPSAPEDDDIADPVRGDEHDFQDMRVLALAAIDAVVECATLARTESGRGRR